LSLSDDNAENSSTIQDFNESWKYLKELDYKSSLGVTDDDGEFSDSIGSSIDLSGVKLLHIN